MESTEDSQPLGLGSSAVLGPAPCNVWCHDPRDCRDECQQQKAKRERTEQEQFEKAAAKERVLQMVHAAVAAERERCVAAVRAAHDDGNAAGIERDVYMWNKAVAHCLRRVLRA